ncbi:hypothetical protein [Candidatus Reidiella endopervernicosa]|uniref:Ig-like domain-containing protein n=1 Tax=Candidatus Reidiella endopervernicosa TaxID=2738883 RepID=A0A6N0HRY2_9GAMM|nr:hypothetical protein [Candidatus Reidiella endopervernicosa]QKQ25068.1 hypothetical protein HUE57_01295 [Candidatus Reidiella endopervernicosa]
MVQLRNAAANMLILLMAWCGGVAAAAEPLLAPPTPFAVEIEIKRGELPPLPTPFPVTMTLIRAVLPTAPAPFPVTLKLKRAPLPKSPEPFPVTVTITAAKLPKPFEVSITLKRTEEGGGISSLIGTWQCSGSGSPLVLKIPSMKKSAKLTANYRHAHGGRPASEELLIESLSETSAKGSYTYRDSNPRIGPTGARGVWTGSWSISVSGDAVLLTRSDDASGWSGSYKCTR